jgi:hypothetical protein
MLHKFIGRMKRIGIELECVGNYPWIYLVKVNGKRVTEKFRAEHGFTIAFLTNSMDGELTDIKEITRLLRTYR